MKNLVQEKVVRLFACVAALCLLVSLSGVSVHAADKYWAADDGWWNTDANWSPSGAPQSVDNVFLTSSDDSSFRTISFDGAYPGAALGNLRIDATGTGSLMTLSMDDYDHLLAVNIEYLGYEGTGEFTQSTGTHVVEDRLLLGYLSGSLGIYNLSGGQLLVERETIGRYGVGEFTQSGGTNTVTEGLYFGYFSTGSGTYSLSGGTLTANAVYMTEGDLFIQTGGTLDAGEFNQDGGTVQGALENRGTFNYSAGAFDARLLNHGVLNLAPDFTAGDGMANYAEVTLDSGGSLTLNGQGLDNSGIMYLDGGTLLGDGQLTNNGLMSGYGVIAGSGGFVNNAQFTQTGGNINLDNAGSNVNNANMDLEIGRLLRLNGGDLENRGSLNLNGAILIGTAGLYNGYGGVISGRGTISTAFSNNGGVLLVESGVTNVIQAFDNSGVIQLAGNTANLNGGDVTNTGTIQGFGQVASNVVNNGIIEAFEGTLTMGGQVSNTANGLMAASTGNKLLMAQGLAENQGVLNLTGGTFDNNNHALTNTGQVSGYGTLRSGELINDDTVILTGGITTVNGDVTNNADMEVAYDSAVFTGNVVNYGTFKTTDTTVTFAGSYTENGVYVSDPSDNYYTDWTIGQSGSVIGGVGDNFFVSGDFINNSLEAGLWNTDQASLTMNGEIQQMALAGADLGALSAGYDDNFAWGDFSLESGVSLYLNDGNAEDGAALYVGLVSFADELEVQLDRIFSEYNIYYDFRLLGNEWLGGETYDLVGGGQLVAVSLVPVPGAVWLLGSGLLGLLGLRRKFRK